MNTGRRELKKVRDFLLKNRTWLCMNNCNKENPNCKICTMTFLIKTSYSANKKADVLTFIHSYLYEPFSNVYKLFLKHQVKNNWNEEIRYKKRQFYGK